MKTIHFNPCLHFFMYRQCVIITNCVQRSTVKVTIGLKRTSLCFPMSGPYLHNAWLHFNPFWYNYFVYIDGVSRLRTDPQVKGKGHIWIQKNLIMIPCPGHISIIHGYISILFGIIISYIQRVCHYYEQIYRSKPMSQLDREEFHHESISG